MGTDDAQAGPRGTAPGEESWFQDWFGEEYLDLYPHRDTDEARAGVGLLLRSVPLRPGASFLDLACGAGRHLQALRERGVHAQGLDLSPVLLARTREQVPDALLVRGDMRHLPYRSQAFEVVTSFFTSFGYFSHSSDDRRVVEEVFRILHPGGHFLLDFLHAPPVRTGLPRSDEERRGAVTIVQDRRLEEEGRVVAKRIEIRRPPRPPRVFHERVRLYDPRELEALFRAVGFTLEARFGGYDGSPLAPESTRCILLGRKP